VLMDAALAELQRAFLDDRMKKPVDPRLFHG
jgi:hypothetical protein